MSHLCHYNNNNYYYFIENVCVEIENYYIFRIIYQNCSHICKNKIRQIKTKKTTLNYQNNLCLYIFIYIYMCVCIRPMFKNGHRFFLSWTDLCVCVYGFFLKILNTNMYIYIYIYVCHQWSVT